MAVTPHADDAEGQAGGTIAKWVDEGYEAIYVIVTNGDKGSRDLQMASEKLAGIREQEQRAAARILGVKETIFLGYPDGFLEDTPGFRQELTRLIRKYRPQKVLTCDPYRHYLLHHDHRVTGIVALEAVFPTARDHLFYPEHLAQGLLPHKVQEVYLWGSEQPNTYIDIQSTFERKASALWCHQSQIGHLTESYLKERQRERAMVTGEPHHLPLAEAFHRIEIGF